MHLKSFSILLAIVTSFFCSVASSQSVFPRDGNEVLAMRIHNKYVQSRVLLAQLETARDKTKGFISEVAPASTMVGTAIDPDDTNRLNALNSLIATEIDRLHKLEAAWDSNRATANGPVVTFAGRYGPLSSSFEKSTANPSYGKIEYAIRTFPFATQAPTTASTSADPRPALPPVPNIGGAWYGVNPGINRRGGVEIEQSGGQLVFINEVGNRSRGHFAPGRVDVVVATDWGNLEGSLVDNRTRINWSNNTYWTR